MKVLSDCYKFPDLRVLPKFLFCFFFFIFNFFGQWESIKLYLRETQIRWLFHSLGLLLRERKKTGLSNCILVTIEFGIDEKKQRIILKEICVFLMCPIIPLIIYVRICIYFILLLFSSGYRRALLQVQFMAKSFVQGCVSEGLDFIAKLLAHDSLLCKAMYQKVWIWLRSYSHAARGWREN